METKYTFKKSGLHIGIALIVAFILALSMSQIAKAATLTGAALQLGDSRPSETGSYTLTADGFTTGSTIGCIEVDLGASNDGTGAIPGIDTSSSTFGSQTITATGTWTVDNSQSADHILRLTNATPVAPQSGIQTAVWNGVVNGNTADTGYYAVFTTYATSSCTTPVDTTTVQFIYTEGQTVTANIDPTLTFTVDGTASGTTCNGAASNVNTTSTAIPFGTPTPSENRIGVQNLTVTTNAGNGYTVYTRYTGQLASGANTIADHTGTNAAPTAFPAPGTEAYGYTTNDSSLGTGTADRFTNPSNSWAAETTSNEEVAYNAAAINNQTTCVGHQIGVSGTTSAGDYSTTVIYTATPVY